MVSIYLVRPFLVVLFFFLSACSPFLHASLALAQDSPAKSASRSDQVMKGISLTTEEQAWINKGHTVRVRVGDYPPTYFIEDGKPYGIAIDLLNEVSRRSGVAFQFIVPSPVFKEDLVGLLQHTGPDLLPTLQATPERETHILFTDAYFVNPRFIFTRDDAPFVSSIEELSGKTVAVENGFLVQKWLREKYPEITLLSFKNTADALKAISLGQAFAYIGPIRVTATLINKNGYVNLKASAPSSLPDGSAQMGIRNDWPELQSIINKVLNSIPPDEKSQIINKWAPIKFDHGISSDDMVKWILISVGFVLVILIAFTVWNWHLRRQVRIRTADVIDSEKRFRVTFEQAAVGITHVSLDGRFLRINKKFCDIVGYSHEEMLALTFQEITHPDDLTENLENVNELLSGNKKVLAIEKRYIRKDDATVWVNLTSTIVRDENDEPDYFVTVGEDISERKRVEEALKKSEQKFRALMEQSPFSVVMNSPDGRMEQVNQAFMEMWGVSEEALPEVMENYSVLEDEEAKKRGVMPLIERAFAGEAVVLPVIEYDTPTTMEHLGVDIGASDKRWVQVRFYPIKNDSGEIINVVATEEDVSARKLAEFKSHESEKKFYDLVEQSPVAFELYDLNGTLQQVNRAFEKLWQVPRENVVGKYNVFESDQIRELGFLEYFEKAYGGEDVSAPDVEFDTSREFGARGEGGQKRWVSTKLYPVKSTSDQVTHVALMHEDLDEQMNSRDKIVTYQGRLRSLASELTLTEEKERRHLAAELHDHIGQTLAFTRIKVAQAQKHVHGGKLTGLLEEISQSLLQTIQDMKELVFDLSSPLLHELGLHAAIKQWLESNIAEKYGLEYELVSDRTKFNLSKDSRFLLFRNVRELLNNVIRHAKASKIIVHLVLGEQTLTIVVWDDGVGFDEEELVNTQYEKQKFGLFSIRERMEDMGGTMEIVTGPGKGCKVLLRLPVDEKSEQGNE